MSCVNAVQPGVPTVVSRTGERSVRHVKTLNAGMTIFREGDTANSIYQLDSGVARLSKTVPDGRRQVLGFLFVGDFFTPSGFAMSTYDQAICTADAVTEITFACQPLDKLDALLSDQPRLARYMLAAAGHELFKLQQQMLLLGRMSAIERVVWFLLRMKEQQSAEGDASIQLPMSRLDIADYLGLRIETVSRTLRYLRDHCIIKLNGKAEVSIIDSAKLHVISGGIRTD